jgi:hypothetical protein
LPDGAKVQTAARVAVGPHELGASPLWTLRRLRFLSAPSRRPSAGQSPVQAHETIWLAVHLRGALPRAVAGQFPDHPELARN